MKDQRKQNSIKDQVFCTASFSTKKTACAVNASATVKPEVTTPVMKPRFRV
jgi:hypothetical protein